MDIAGLSMALAQTNVQNDFSVAMLSKAMDTSETLGEGMVEMLDSAAMERSVTPYIGGNIDISVQDMRYIAWLRRIFRPQLFVQYEIYCIIEVWQQYFISYHLPYLINNSSNEFGVKDREEIVLIGFSDFFSDDYFYNNDESLFNISEKTQMI